MMNKLIFNETSYDVAENGINVSTNALVADLVTDDFDGVEATVAPVDEIIQTLDDGTKVAAYKGYTKLISLTKKFHQIVDYTTTEEGEAVPIYADVIVVTLFRPTLEDIVADQGEQITEIQEVLAEII